MPTKIVPCKCESNYMDATYGKGMRVANKTINKNPNMTTWRCTKCGAEHTFGQEREQKK